MFYFFFEKFFPPNTIFAALILWRSITFYLQIFSGFTAALIDQALSARRMKKQSAMLSDEEEVKAQTPQPAADALDKGPSQGAI